MIFARFDYAILQMSGGRGAAEELRFFCPSRASVLSKQTSHQQPRRKQRPTIPQCCTDLSDCFMKLSDYHMELPNEIRKNTVAAPTTVT